MTHIHGNSSHSKSSQHFGKHLDVTNDYDDMLGYEQVQCDISLQLLLETPGAITDCHKTYLLTIYQKLIKH